MAARRCVSNFDAWWVLALGAFALGALALTVSGCSAEEGGSTGNGIKPDAGGDAAEPGAGSSSSPGGTVCTGAQFDKGDFRSAGQVTITAKMTNGDWTYVNNCARLKAGQTATFTMDFKVHPLIPQPGSVPNVIPTTGDGTTTTVTFSEPGIYGYYCAAHPTMSGEVQVVAE